MRKQKGLLDATGIFDPETGALAHDGLVGPSPGFGPDSLLLVQGASASASLPAESLAAASAQEPGPAAGPLPFVPVDIPGQGFTSAQ